MTSRKIIYLVYRDEVNYEFHTFKPTLSPNYRSIVHAKKAS